MIPLDVVYLLNLITLMVIKCCLLYLFVFFTKNNSDYSLNLGFLSLQELQFPLIAFSPTLATPTVMI